MSSETRNVSSLDKLIARDELIARAAAMTPAQRAERITELHQRMEQLVAEATPIAQERQLLRQALKLIEDRHLDCRAELRILASPAGAGEWPWIGE